MKKLKFVFNALYIFISLALLAGPGMAQDLSEPPVPDGFPVPPPIIDSGGERFSQDLDPGLANSGHEMREGIAFYSGSGSPNEVDEADGMEEDDSGGVTPCGDL